jgi:hypothetical protein
MKSFSFSFILKHENSMFTIENIKKLCIGYTKKLMKPYQFERQYLKKINLLFNVIRPFKFKYGLVSFGRTQTLISTCDDMKRQFI